MTPPLRPIPGETLADAGQVYVTQAAARAYAAAAGTLPEEARRTLTELLLDARPLPEPAATGATQWRHRSRTTGLDVTAHVVREGRLLVVVHVHVRGVPRRGPRNRTR